MPAEDAGIFYFYMIMTPSPSGILLSTAYFPPIPYFWLIKNNPDIVLIEKHENYCKQSYRNRCNILAANGVLPLVVPVKRNRGSKTMISEIRPDYTYSWQKLHRVSIESAYRSAPFFEYYIDEIMPFLTKKYDFLLDLNISILETILRILDIPAKPVYTDGYNHTPPNGIIDSRHIIHPKSGSGFSEVISGKITYTQVFGDRAGFIGGLTILDLLFNTGPDAGHMLSATV